MLPSSWKSKMPGLLELADYLAGAYKTPGKFMFLSAFLVERAWELAPSWTRVLRNSQGAWFNNSAEQRLALNNSITEQVLSDGRWNDQPVYLAKRYKEAAMLYYGQCVKRGHFLHISPFEGAEECDLVVEEAYLKTTIQATLIHALFHQQIGICKAHSVDTCVSCQRIFRLREQEARFWVSKTTECQECLYHQLMYFEPKHHARSLVVSNSERRKLHRLEKWDVEFTSLPPGVNVPPTLQPTDLTIQLTEPSFLNTDFDTSWQHAALADEE